MLTKRQKKLQGLQNELTTLARVTTDTHLRRNIDAYAEWIRIYGPTATLGEIEGVKKEIIKLVRPSFCYGLLFLTQRASTNRQ